MQSLGFLKIFFLALGLSVDAFIASAALGAAVHRDRLQHALKLAIYLALFHGAMPVLGWMAGRNFFALIQPYDHWAAFFLLSFVGVKLYREEVNAEESPKAFRLQSLIFLCFALSIDALVIGMTLSFLNFQIAGPSIGMGLVAFSFSLLGFYVGYRLKKLNSQALKKVGGLLLIAIGLKILWDHLSS